MLLWQQFFQFHGHETLNEILSMFFIEKVIQNSHTQVFYDIPKVNCWTHMFLNFDNNKVILKNLTRWKFSVKKEEMSREKRMYGISIKTTFLASVCGLISDTISMPNTAPQKKKKYHNMGRYRSVHKTQDAKCQEQGFTNFPKIY